MSGIESLVSQNSGSSRELDAFSASSFRQREINFQSSTQASFTRQGNRLNISIRREISASMSEREETLLTLSTQAINQIRDQNEKSSLPQVGQGQEDHFRKALEDSNLETDKHLFLLLLSRLLKREDTRGFKSLTDSVVASRDLEADFKSILEKAGQTEATLQDVLAKAETTQAEVDRELQAQAALRRQTMGATVASVTESTVQVKLVDETVLNIQISEDTSEEEVAAFLDESLTIGEFVEAVGGQIVTADPVVLDLKGDGIHRGELTQEFDLNADGKTDRMESLGSDDAFLVMDRNANGEVDDGTELFGEHRGATDGFEELRNLDENRDGVLDEKDTSFGDLKLWVDQDGDGQRSRSELSSLKDHEISAIVLPEKDTAHFGVERYSSFIKSGKSQQAADLWLKYQTIV